MNNLSDTPKKARDNIYKSQLKKNNNGTTNPQAKTHKITRNNIFKFTSHWTRLREESLRIMKESILETEPWQL